MLAISLLAVLTTSRTEEIDFSAARASILPKLMRELEKGEWSGSCGTSDPGGRRASEVILKFGPDAESFLINGLYSGNNWVQYSSAQILQKLGATTAVPHLRDTWEKATWGITQGSVLGAMSKLDPRGSFEFIAARVGKMKENGEDAALRALGDTKDERAVDILKDHLNETSAWSAADALAKLGDRGWEVLQANQDSKTEAVRDAVIRQAFESNHPVAIPICLREIESGNYKVRVVNSNAPEIHLALWRLLRDGNEEAKAFAAKNLSVNKADAMALGDCLQKAIAAKDANTVKNLGILCAKADPGSAGQAVESALRFLVKSFPEEGGELLDSFAWKNVKLSTGLLFQLSLSPDEPGLETREDLSYRPILNQEAARICREISGSGPRLFTAWKAGQMSNLAFASFLSGKSPEITFEMLKAALDSKHKELTERAISAFEDFKDDRVNNVLRRAARAGNELAERVLAVRGDAEFIRKLAKSERLPYNFDAAVMSDELLVSLFIYGPKMVQWQLLTEVTKRGLPKTEKAILALVMGERDETSYMRFELPDSLLKQCLNSADPYIQTEAYFRLEKTAKHLRG